VHSITKTRKKQQKYHIMALWDKPNIVASTKFVEKIGKIQHIFNTSNKLHIVAF